MRRDINTMVRCARICCAVAVALCGFSAGALAWERPHGDGANTSFADVQTLPVRTAPVTVPGLGSFATGAGL